MSTPPTTVSTEASAFDPSQIINPIANFLKTAQSVQRMLHLEYVLEKDRLDNGGTELRFAAGTVPGDTISQSREALWAARERIDASIQAIDVLCGGDAETQEETWFRQEAVPVILHKLANEEVALCPQDLATLTYVRDLSTWWLAPADDATEERPRRTHGMLSPPPMDSDSDMDSM